MADYNCKCDPGFPNGITGPIVPFWGFSAFTPTIPKLYWDVKSQEQRILNLFDLLNKLICYANNMGMQIDVNIQDIADLKDELQDLKDGGFLNQFEQQIMDWVNATMVQILAQAAHQVFFGLTDDGYFCAYIPQSWREIVFDTGAVYGTEQYGRLILRFDATGTGIIDNTATNYGGQ